MTQGVNDEALWLQFFLRRLRAALRYAEVVETSTILRELIRVVEDRLDELEKN